MTSRSRLPRGRQATESRRRAILAASGIAAEVLFGSARADDDPGFIDAHTHVWTDDTERYPLAAGFRKEAMAPPTFTPEEFLAHARPAGVRRAVLIQMSYYGFDNRYMLDCIAARPDTFVGVAVIDPENHPAETMRQLSTKGVRGFRIVPGKQPETDWLTGPGMRTMWTAGADQKLAMCPLIDPVFLPSVDRACAQFPKTPVVVDHFARIGIDGTVRPTDLDALCRLARHPLASVKVSAFYALGQKKPPYEDLGPMIRRLMNAFGRERLMWASDCPFQVQNGHSYRDSIELIRHRLDFLDEDDRQWLLRRTAEKVFFSR